ncbi:MAG TPA: PRC-barrel domain-containing protein [Gaiellaceae bacterium]|nr:PRC-barrel domain-containing protein [Gaiellaceae bacterium]
MPPAVCAGDAVLAEDGFVGNVVEILQTDAGVPAYVIVSVGRFLRRRYPVVHWSFVIAVDGSRRLVRVRGSSEVIRRLPETLPIVL